MPSIRDSDFERNIAPAHVGMLAITVAPTVTTESDPDLVEAFTRAYRAISPKIQIKRRILIFFLTGPTHLNTSAGTLTVQLTPSAVNAYMEDLIFIDAQRMRGISTERKVVGILEELAHVLLGIVDEILIKQVVCLLLAGVSWDGQRYVFQSEQRA